MLTTVGGVLSAGAFTSLTPSDLRGRVLYAGELDQWNFELEAPSVTAYAPKGFFQPVLRDSLRRMGGEVFERVAFDPADTPDHFRLRAGFYAALLPDRDGAYLPDAKDLPAPYARALELAAEDRKVALRLGELVELGMSGTNRLVGADARRARQWSDRVFGWRDLGADDLRLELGAWIRRLEAVLGLEHEASPQALGSLGERPAYEIPATLAKVQVGSSVSSVPLDPAGDVRFSCNYRTFSLAFSATSSPVRVTLTFDTLAAPRFCHEVVFLPPPPTAPADLPPPASFPARGLMNGVEPHFVAPPAWRAVPHEPYSRTYPNPSFSWRGRVLSGSLDGFGPLAPMAAAGRRSRWRVTVRDAKGTLCDCVLVWPAGSEASQREGRLARTGGRDGLEKSWQKAVDGLFARYAASALEARYRFVSVGERCFEIGDVASDDLFWQAYAKRFWLRRPTPERLETLAWDVADARREFLACAFADGPFRARVADREKPAAATVKAPDADVEAGCDLPLDDD